MAPSRAEPLPDPEYIPLTDAANRYSAHRDTLRRAIIRGEINAVRLPNGRGGDIRVRVADLEAWVQPIRTAERAEAARAAG